MAQTVLGAKAVCTARIVAQPFFQLPGAVLALRLRSVYKFYPPSRSALDFAVVRTHVSAACGPRRATVADTAMDSMPLSFVPRATAIQVPARKFRRDYASERAQMHLRAMDEVRAARASGEGHANCVVTVLE